MKYLTEKQRKDVEVFREYVIHLTNSYISIHNDMVLDRKYSLTMLEALNRATQALLNLQNIKGGCYLTIHNWSPDTNFVKCSLVSWIMREVSKFLYNTGILYFSINELNMECIEESKKIYNYIEPIIEIIVES